jgi:coiled-coil and C2 domain-containing protein 2A
MLHPFVEVVFRGQRKRTVTSAGTYPLFNESLTLDFEIPGHKLEPKVLRMVREDVHVNLYDEVTIEMDKDDRRENVIYERRERRWLGSFRIPFSTIYANRKVEGTFRMNVPVVNLGYDPPDPEEGIEGIPDTRLSLYVVLEPPLELFEEEPEEVCAASISFRINSQLTTHC